MTKVIKPVLRDYDNLSELERMKRLSLDIEQDVEALATELGEHLVLFCV